MDTTTKNMLNQMCPAAREAALGTMLADIQAGMPPDEAITPAKLHSSVAGLGLAGGAGDPLEVKVDDATIEINNDTVRAKDGGLTPAKLAATAVYRVRLSHLLDGDITASLTAKVIGYAHGAGTIVRAGFGLGTTGTDATDDLAAEMDVLIGETSIFTTKPALTSAAADGATTYAAGDGVTEGVIDDEANAVTAGDPISVALDLTRTTPEEEMANAVLEVEVAYKVGA